MSFVVFPILSCNSEYVWPLQYPIIFSLVHNDIEMRVNIKKDIILDVGDKCLIFFALLLGFILFQFVVAL